MNTFNGYLNEDRLANAINGKTYDELNANLQYLVSTIFQLIENKEKFRCSKTEEYIKPDIMIQYKDDMKFLSVKSGTSETLHTEQLTSFIEFLKENKIDEEAIKTYLMYHFGDGTTDGTGVQRMDSVEVRFRLGRKLDELNEALNRSKDFVKKFADRVMFDGVNPDAYKADIIYHGDVDYGVFINKKQMKRQIDVKNWSFMDSCVHVGPFVIRPKARYAGKEIRNENNLKAVVVTYPKLLADIMYISRRFGY